MGPVLEDDQCPQALSRRQRERLSLRLRPAPKLTLQLAGGTIPHDLHAHAYSEAGSQVVTALMQAFRAARLLGLPAPTFLLAGGRGGGGEGGAPSSTSERKTPWKYSEKNSDVFVM